MIIKGINRGEPDQVFIICRNMETSTTMSVGHGVVFEYVGTTNQDGVNVKYQDGTENVCSVAGIVAERDIAAGDYGLIQTYGHCDVISITGTISHTTSQGGYIFHLNASTSQGRAGLFIGAALATNDIPTGALGCIVIPGEVKTTPTTGTTIKGFIKAM